MKKVLIYLVLSGLSLSILAQTGCDSQKAKDKKPEPPTPKEMCETTKAPSCDPKTFNMKKVEGKWIPEDVVATWSQQIEVAKAQVAAMDKKAMAAQKPQIMMGLAAMDGAIEQIASTKTQEEFDTAMMGVMGMFMGPQ